MKRFPFAALSICLALLTAGIAPQASAQEVKIVAHPDISRSTLSRDEIRQIFLGRKTQWDDGNQRVHFVVLKEGDTHETFVRQFVGKTPSQFSNYWKKMIFTGKGRAPQSFATPEDVVALVAETAGAVGYVPPETDTPGVKIISITAQ